MIRKVLSVFLLTGMLVSCSSIRHTSDTVAVNNTVTTFTVADLKVSPNKATKTTSWSYNPFKRVSVATIKDNTEAALVNENNADILLEPQYIIEKRGFMRGGSVTVIGFPAKFENFHKMTQEEAEIVKNINGSSKPDCKPKKRWIFF